MSNHRPISPHLTIYKYQLTSMLSLFHRMTGVILSLSVFFSVFIVKVGTLNLTIYNLYSISTYLNTLSNWLVISILFGLLLSFYYHLYNGIRHLIWDNGSALELEEVYKSGYFVLFATILSTVITWIYIII